MLAKPMKKHLLFVLCLLVAPVASYADIAGWSVTVSPQPALPLEPIFAHITNALTCAIDPSRVELRQDGTTIYVVTRVDATSGCIPAGGGSALDVSLGQFQAGTFNVVVTDSQNVQETSAPFIVKDNGTSGSVSPVVDYSDHWWDPNESGWGMSIVQHADHQLFAIWFVYGNANQPIWYTLQSGHWTSPTSFTGIVYKTSGPYFGGLFDPHLVTVAQAGAGTLSFESPTSGLFAYTIDGVTATKPISRLAF